MFNLLLWKQFTLEHVDDKGTKFVNIVTSPYSFKYRGRL